MSPCLRHYSLYHIPPVTKYRVDAAHHTSREAEFGFSPSLLFESFGT